MRTAIVTGGSRGFGRAAVSCLIDDGWDVVIDGRDGRSLTVAAHSLGPRAHAVVGDINDATHREQLVREAVHLGSLELVMNNASSLGPSPLPPLCDVSLDELVALHLVNVVAPLALVQLALPQLRANHGAVINVTSDAAVEAYEGWGAYGSTKAALEQLSNVLSVEEPEVRTWWLDPGDMRTDMHQAAFPGEDISDRPLPELIAPAVLALLAARPSSGRVRAEALLDGARP